MGLIKAAVGSVGGVLADQWKEFFYCEALPREVLVSKGQKRVSSRSSNTRGSDNIISNGSGIAVADGQCMIIVEQGKIVEVCAEPGEYTYDTSTEPSIFEGSLGESIKQTFKTIGKRFAYGGDTGKDQRVYYFNTKEITGNKFGTATPIPFRVVDMRVGLDLDTSVRCNGVYSYKITNPLLFYTNISGNVADKYYTEQIENQLKNEFVSALQPAFAALSALEIRPNQIPAHTRELSIKMNDELSSEWSERRGIEVVSIAIGSLSLPEEDQADIKQAQKAAAYSNPAMGAGVNAFATANAMEKAAANPAGAMTGFMGMGMAMNNSNTANLYAAAAQQGAGPVGVQQNNAAGSWKCSCGASATGNFCTNCGAKKPAPVSADSWKCSCGATASGNFCQNCGAKKPASEGWTCKCGSVNKGMFCPNCGEKKPAGAPLYKCDKCGWEPEDPHNPPKFCPVCGDRFDDSDIV